MADRQNGQEAKKEHVQVYFRETFHYIHDIFVVVDCRTMSSNFREASLTNVKKEENLL